MNLRNFITLTFMSAAIAGGMAERHVSYARANQNVTLDLNWGPDNYGEIVWQTSTDNGATWNTVANANAPKYTVRVTGPALYRAVVTGDPACPPVIEEREIKTVGIDSEVMINGSDYIEIEVSAPDLKDVDIKEYGFTAAFAGVGRSYAILPRHRMGDKPTFDADGSFTMRCDGLKPSANYSLRPYFVTADGSVVFGGGKSVTTIPGLMFDSEDWVIEKTTMQIPFSIPGYDEAGANPELWFGKDRNSLKKYNVENLGNNKYRSEMISGLAPGTPYVVVVKADVYGQKVEISKEVRTWSDYSQLPVDNTVKPVSHVVEWDNKSLVTLTPENLQVEYPRMCRVDENKLLLTYHGGTTDHWQNSYLRKSYDNGRTWTDPVEIYKVGNQFLGSGYNRICNPEMTRLSNGWIILTVVANANPETNDNCKVMACISKDGGETWGDPIVVGRGRTWEPQVIQMPNGELELLVSSEAYWWDHQRDNLFQEILSTRSTDNGETWTTYKRASYKPGARDGMPVSVVMQGNKGVMFIEESVNGGIPPSLQHRTLDGEWDTSDWDGIEDDSRWLTKLNNGAGAPHMIQLPTGEFLIMAHSNQTGSVWQTNRSQVIMADNTGHNFKYSRVPLSGTALPAQCGAYYASFFLYDNDTVWLLFTKAQYDGTRRVESDVVMMPGKIVEK